MKREIFVLGGTERLIAVAEDGRLVECLREQNTQNVTEAIYLGKVVRVVNSMQAAFVDIGEEKNGFLPIREKSETFEQTPLRDGMRILVQMKKAAHDGKGAFLSRDITLCGQYVLVMPLNRHVGVSARVEEADRAPLKVCGREIAENRFGIVMRQAALQATQGEIADEAEALFAMWQKLAAQAPTAHAPSMLLKPRTLLESVLDDYRPRGINRIVTDDPSVADDMIPVEHMEKLSLASTGFGKQLEHALQRRVWLDCGGNLVIDPCEAMTVIDVNSAKNTGRRMLEDTILRTNLEAAEEAARQIRLRNLSGIILIDMIDLQEPAHREQVLDTLREALKKDRIKTVVHGMTSLGLVEMTRKKERTPLRDDWTEPCPCCGGNGRIQKELQHG